MTKLADSTTKSLNDALGAFIKHNCIPILEGGGEIGGINPKAIDCEIRIKLHEDGSGYIHKLGEDSTTENFQLNQKDELKEALEHINHLIDRFGTCSDTVTGIYKRDAAAFLLKHDEYYKKLTGKKKTEYAKDFYR